jgi:hypothetical protein
MAKSNVSISWSVASARYLARLPARQLWQVPVLMLGMLVLGAALVQHAFSSSPESRKMQRELSRAYQLIADPKGDMDQVCALAEHVLEVPGRTKQQAAQAHFLLGMVHARQAGRTTGPLADEEFRRAKEELEQAAVLGVPEADEPRLQYQLGKAGASLQEPAATVIQHLSLALPEGADDPAEGYNLLIQAYLQLEPANVDGALDANTHLLNLPTLADDLAAPAYLQRGELLMRKNDTAGARKALEKIRPSASASILTRARQLLAASYQSDRSWKEAAKHWKLLAEGPASVADRARFLYSLGLCERESNQFDNASVSWEKCLEVATGDEEQAAALGLAELRLQSDPPGSLRLFERALRTINGPPDWNNRLIGLGAAQERFESAWQTCLQEGRHDQALHIAQIYAKLGPAGRGHQLAAQAAEERCKGLEGEPREKACQLAATEYEISAEATFPEHDRAERLWSSVQCYLAARAADSVVRVLELMARTNELPEKQGEGWYRLAQLFLATGQGAPQGSGSGVAKDKAQHAYQECLKYPGKFQYRARYFVAREKLANGDVDGAITDLNRNLGLLAVELDREAHENTLFELANILFHRQDYRQALVRLTQALELYGEGPHMITARYQVAECHRKLAEQARDYLRDSDRLPPSAEEYYRNQRQDSYRDAYTCYHELSELLAPRLKNVQSNDDDRSLYRVARFNEAECLFQAGKYPKALEVYQELSVLYFSQVERLHALAGKRRCFFAMGEVDKARAMLDDMKRALDELHESCFDPKISKWPRQKWTEWLDMERRNDTQPPFRADNLQNLRPSGFLNSDSLKPDSGGK